MNKKDKFNNYMLYPFTDENDSRWLEALDLSKWQPRLSAIEQALIASAIDMQCFSAKSQSINWKLSARKEALKNL